MASAHGARTAATWGTGLLNENRTDVLNELGKGYDASQGYLGKANDLYSGMAAQGLGGLDRYKALTTGSNEDITQALYGTPGYGFAMDQGLQGLSRARAAQGMLGSGNTDADAIKFSQGLASQTLGQERQALLPLVNLYQQGIGGQAGVYGTQAGNASDYYTSRANAYDDTTKNIVGLGSQALIAGDQAKSQNQANMLNAGMGVLKGFTSLFSGGMGLGGAKS
jgi:hypothetical protein